MATINHEKGYVQNKEIKDIYSTFEPQKAYQSRILFLNNIYVESQRSMKYSSQQEQAQKEARSKELEEEEDMSNNIEKNTE